TACPTTSAGSGACPTSRRPRRGSRVVICTVVGSEARWPWFATRTATVTVSPDSGGSGATLTSAGRSTRAGSGPSTVRARLVVLSSSRDSATWRSASATTYNVRVPARPAVGKSKPTGAESPGGSGGTDESATTAPLSGEPSKRRATLAPAADRPTLRTLAATWTVSPSPR